MTLGGWCAIGSPFSAELLGHAGYDWLCIDTQHGLIGYEQMVLMLQALGGTPTPAFVRLPDSNAEGIMKALDAGAAGVIVPLVESAEEATAIVQACRYPPEGIRSWGPIRASLTTIEFSPESANRDVICVVMVETLAGISELDAILSVPGVDAVFIGPNDLALTSGLKASSSAHTDLILSIQRACRKHNVVAGIAAGNTETALRWQAAGFEMLALPSDVALLTQGASVGLDALRKAAGLDLEDRKPSAPAEI